MEGFEKKIFVVYDKWNFKPQISPIVFNFDQVNNGWIRGLLCIKPFNWLPIKPHDKNGNSLNLNSRQNSKETKSLLSYLIYQLLKDDKPYSSHLDKE